MSTDIYSQYFFYPLNRFLQGNQGAQNKGLAAAPNSVDKCVAGILSRVVGATRDESGGKFLNYARVKSDYPGDFDEDEMVW